MRVRKQIPGQLYTFVSKKLGMQDTGTLPQKLGESNSFVYWTGGNRPTWASRLFCAKRHKTERKKLGLRVFEDGYQTPEKSWEFVDRKSGAKHSVILPKIGESNSEVYWHKQTKHKNGGTWHSRYLRRLRDEGASIEGLLGRMRRILSAAKVSSPRRGYVPVRSTPEEMLEQWNSQNNTCICCGGRLEVLSANYDHDHETGVPRGFAHRWCNHAEGFVNKMNDEEFENFVVWERKKRVTRVL